MVCGSCILMVAAASIDHMGRHPHLAQAGIECLVEQADLGGSYWPLPHSCWEVIACVLFDLQVF
jgi:hypothetical protein